MDRSMQLLVGVAAGSVTSLLAYAIYRWRQRRRAHLVGKWVREYLCGQYGEVPVPLHVNCSDDRLWPVMVDFSSPRTGVRHRLQFACPGAGASFALLSDREESH